MLEPRCNSVGLWAVALVVCAGCGGSDNPPAASASGTGPSAVTGMGGERMLAAGNGAATAGAVTNPGTGAAPAASNASGAGVMAPQMQAPATSVAEVPNEWHQMGYDERNHYHNPVETTLSPDNAGKLEMKWMFTVAGFPPGSPIIADGKVFVLATGGLYALELETGKQVWLRDDLTGTSSAAYAAGSVYVHTGAAELYKVNAADGKTVWGPTKTHDSDAADGMSSPILANGKVIVGLSAEAAEIDLSGRLGDAQRAARGGVFAADAETGQMSWRYATIAADAPENGAMVWSSVGVDLQAGTVVATTGNNWNMSGANSDAFHMLDLATGTKLWVHQVRTTDLWNIGNGTGTNRDTDFGANPIVVELAGKKIVAAGDKGSEFWALDATTGEPLWNRTALSSSHNEANGGILNNGAFDGDYFYVVANQPSGQPSSILHALDASKEGADAWPAKTFNKVTWGMPTVANGVLVVPIDDDLYILNAKTGDMLAMFPTGGSIAAGGAAIAQAKIVVASGLQYQIAGATLAKNNNQIYCFGLPGGSVPTAGSGASAGQPSGAGTWSAVYQEIIVGKGCNGQPACHASEAGGGLNMRSKELAYMSLVGVAAMGMDAAGGAQQCVNSGLQRVRPSDPGASLLVQKIEHTQSCGGPMPSAAETLPATQLQQVRTWIMNGAPND